MTDDDIRENMRKCWNSIKNDESLRKDHPMFFWGEVSGIQSACIWLEIDDIEEEISAFTKELQK